ncbi:MAG: penicillin-binding protein 1A [Parvibaculales bacterium]
MRFLKLMSNLAGVGITLGAVGLFVLVLVLWRLNSGLPNYEHLANYTPPVMSRAHAGDGQLIAEYAQERRIFVPIDTAPDHLIDAFLAAEDKNFYEHSGIDFTGILRAVFANVVNVATGRRLEGASTITQQVAKNFLLSSDVTIERKLKEAVLAMRLERTFSKRQLLELYLNEIYLGLGSYGVAAAALNYFDKPLGDLTIAEAAYLAALPKAPNNYHPFRKRARAIARRNWVIGRMRDNGYITNEQARFAAAQDLVVADRPASLRRFAAEYFVEEVRREVYGLYGEEQLYGGGLSIRTTLNTDLQKIAIRSLRDGLEVYDRRRGYRGAIVQLETLEDWPKQLSGIEIPTDLAPWRLAVVLTVDDELREATIGLRPRMTRARRFEETADIGTIGLAGVRWARAAPSQENGYKIKGPKIKRVSDVLTVGDVVWVSPSEAPSEAEGTYVLKQKPEVNGAMVALDPHTGRVRAMVGGYSFADSEFNRATQASRQPGSAFKPFVYAAALDSGFTPASLVLDAPFVMDQGKDQGLWKPENYARRFYGLSTLRLGMEKSRNLMTIRMAQEIGMNKITDYAARFNINKTMPKVLAMSLGAGETTLMRLTAAYGMLVNGGKRVEPRVIDRVQDRYGKTLFKHDQRACIGCSEEIYNQQTAPDLPDEREQVLSPQTAYQVVSMLEGVVKRGTGRRISAIGKPLAGKTGTTNDSRDAWFVGFSADMVVGVYVGYDDNRTLGKGESGGKVAGPIFKSFMEQALVSEPSPPFRVPPTVSLVRINAKTGKLARSGDETVILEAFKVGTEPAPGGRQAVVGGGGKRATKQRSELETETVGSGTGGLY